MSHPNIIFTNGDFTIAKTTDGVNEGLLENIGQLTINGGL